MPEFLPMRPYQAEAVSAVLKAWADGVQRPAVVMATGLGKTVVLAHLIRACVDRPETGGRWAKSVLKRPSVGRAVVLVHREELVEQTLDKLRQVAPHLSAGVVKADRDETDRDVVVASVQSLARPGRCERITGSRIVIADEAHHYSASTFKDVLTRLGSFTPLAEGGARTVGVTATMSRGDGRGLGSVWESVCYSKDIIHGIAGGFLVDVRCTAVTVGGLNLAAVARSRGDFQEGSLADALEAAGAHEVTARAYRKHAGNRQGILFAPTVAFADQCREAFEKAGIRSALISGATPTEERAAVYRAYRDGEVQVLHSCMVLSEGFDMPQASCCVVARPTQSEALFTQQVGRVLRPFPGKRDALVLDVVGASEVGLRSLVDLSPDLVPPRPGESLGEALARAQAEAKASGGHIPLENLSTRQVDLFQRSASVWLRTYGGVWFIPAGDSLFFLWPNGDGERFMVGRQDKGRRAAAKLHDGLMLSTAMSWAEVEAEETAATVSQRSASWRRRKAPPTAGQVKMLAGFGLPVPERKNEASDAIDVYMASAVFDRHVAQTR